MKEIKVYKSSENAANLSQLPVKRSWMDETVDAHAYRCFPVTLTNSLGWGLSFPEDISFVWDGISDTSGSHVRILEGEKYCFTERANATISFKTGLIFKTDSSTSLLQMPVPNMFWEGAQAFTTIISTSFFSGDLPCAWRITVPNKIITIKANQPFISLLPISLSELQNSEMQFSGPEILKVVDYTEEDHLQIVKETVDEGGWTNFYRDGVDPFGKKIGEHEVKSIRLRTKQIGDKNE